MMRKRYYVLFALLILFSSVITGAYAYFFDYQIYSVDAVSGISLEISDHEHLSDITVVTVEEDAILEKDQSDTKWWGNYNTGLTISAAPKNGYTFLGWFQDDTCISDSLVSSFTLTSPMVLTAQIQPTLYTINYNVNGGTLDELTATYTIEDSVTLPIPENGTYVFDGWYESEDFSDTPVTKLEASTGDKTYYAKWSEAGEKTAFAVYSEDDRSLSFYKRSEVPAVDTTFNGKTVSAVYTGIEEISATSFSDVPWRSKHASYIRSVYVVDVISPISTAYWFHSCSACSYFSLKNLDTSNVTSMKSMFYNAATSSSFTADIEDWDTSNVSDMSYLFFCVARKGEEFNIDLSKWNTSNVTTMSNMFYLSGEYATYWNAGDLKTKSLTDSEGTPYLAWDVSSVTNFTAMFTSIGEGADTFIFDVSNWNTCSAENMTQMFVSFRRNYEGAVIDLDLSTKTVTLENGTSYTAWDVSNVTTMYYMFGYVGKLAESVRLDLSNWKTLNNTSMKWMFIGCGYEAASLELIGLEYWYTSNVTNMDLTFKNLAPNADYSLDLSTKEVHVSEDESYTAWKVTKVTSHEEFAENVSDKIILPDF